VRIVIIRDKIMDEAQFDLFVADLKQQMKKGATTKEQCNEIDKQVEYAAHQTKSFVATIEGNLQKAVRERILAINEQCK